MVPNVSSHPPRRSFLATGLGSLLGLGAGMLGRGRPAEAATYLGRYRGTVQEDLDPLGLGRLLVSVPEVLGPDTAWALPSVPYAGDGVGLYLIPPVGASVWVEFEGGDSSSPVWVGGFWGSDRPPGSDPQTKVLRTTANAITLDDRPEAPSITVQAEKIHLAGSTAFSRSGRAVVPSGHRTKRVTGVPLGVGSVVLATLQRDVPGVGIEAVQTQPREDAFVLYLTQAPDRDIPFGWLAID